MKKDHIVPLQHNESYWILSKSDLAAIKRTITEKSFSTYPNYTILRRQLSKYAKVPQENLLLFPGSDAAISSICEQCAMDKKEIILPIPTFYGYERIMLRHGLRSINTCYREKNGSFIFPLNDTLSELRSDRALFLCNPNNPLGCVIPNEDLVQLLDVAKRKNVLVILDEAYFEFGAITQKKRIFTQPLVIVRTMSKAFGLSGSRIGYVLCGKNIVENLRNTLLPWPISHQSAEAAIALLSREKEIKKRRIKLINEREIFLRKLTDLGLTTYISSTNFILVKMRNADRVANKMREMGINVCLAEDLTSLKESKKILSGKLRMSVPSPSDMHYVISALKQCRAYR